MASQTAKSVRLVYDGDLTESFVYGATYPRAYLQLLTYKERSSMSSIRMITFVVDLSN